MNHNLATAVIGWYGPIVIATWIVAIQLSILCLEFLLGWILPWSAHLIVTSLREVLISIVWIVACWQLHSTLRQRVEGSECWQFQALRWFVVGRTLVALYRVVFVADRTIGFEIIPTIPLILGSADWGLWGLSGVGIVLTILVLLHGNSALDGALVTMGGIASVAIVGVLAMAVDGYVMVYASVTPSAANVQDELALWGLRAGSWGAWMLFRIVLLSLLIAAGRRLKRRVANQQCPRCRYYLVNPDGGCSECGWARPS